VTQQFLYQTGDNSPCNPCLKQYDFTVTEVIANVGSVGRCDWYAAAPGLGQQAPLQQRSCHNSMGGPRHAAARSQQAGSPVCTQRGYAHGDRLCMPTAMQNRCNRYLTGQAGHTRRLQRQRAWRSCTMRAASNWRHADPGLPARRAATQAPSPTARRASTRTCARPATRPLRCPTTPASARPATSAAAPRAPRSASRARPIA